MKSIYLIQSDEPQIPYKISPRSDVLLLQWQDRFVPTKNSFHYPSSTWASGRNELYRRALKQGRYDYYIFMDDDASLSFDLKAFEKMLKKYRPRRAVPALVSHLWGQDPQSLVDRVKYVDHIVLAFRSDCVDAVFPYTLEYDKTCWWFTSRDMCERFWRLWPAQTLRFNNLECVNLLNREYPRHDCTGRPENKVRPHSRRSWLLLYRSKGLYKRLHKKLNSRLERLKAFAANGIAWLIRWKTFP